MAEYGQAARTPTQDANEGVVNPPATRRYAGAGRSQNVRATSDVEGSVDKIGRSLGSALAARLTDEANNINEQRALDANMRQGEATAVNAIDANKKRVGWEKFVFGESVDYRAAQQRAVDNNVNQSYLEQMNQVDSFAGDSNEQYAGRLKSALDEMLAPYENDPETRALVAKKWGAVSQKLTASHSKSHYAHTQLESRRVEGERIDGSFDRINLETQQNTEQLEHEATAKFVKHLFSYGDMPKDMTRGAYRGLMNERLDMQLRQGNIGMYNAANSVGWYNDLNSEERIKLDQAVARYDVVAGQRISQTISQARLAANKVMDEEQLVALGEELRTEMATHEERTSGTEAYKKHVAAAKQQIQSVYSKALDTYDDALEDESRAEFIKQAQALSDEGQSSYIQELQPTKAEASAAFQSRLIDAAAEVTGQENTTIEEAIRSISSNPEVASNVANLWGSATTPTDVVKTIGNSFVRGYNSPLMTDEDGQPTDLARGTVEALSKFESEDEAKFRKEMGSAYDEYKIIQEGFIGGSTQDMIGAELKINREGGEQFYTDWSVLAKNQSKRDYIRQKVTDITGSTPTGIDIGRMATVYNRALHRAKGDHRTALYDMTNELKGNSEFFNGHRIEGASAISQQLPNYSVPELLSSIQHADVNLMLPIISAGMSNPNGIRTMQQLGGNIDIKVDDRGDGIILNHPKWSQAVPLSLDMLKAMDAQTNQAAKQRKLENMAIRKAKDKAMKVGSGLFNTGLDGR